VTDLSAVIAWIPFIEPLPGVERWWMLLVVPLSFGIALTYKALRMPRLDRIWSAAGVMTVQILLGLFGLALAFLILVQVVVPMLPAD
jgi:hypothetical protein